MGPHCLILRLYLSKGWKGETWIDTFATAAARAGLHYIIHTYIPVIVSITTSGYQTRRAEKEKVTERLHARGKHLVGALGVGVYTLPQTQLTTAVSHTKLHDSDM